MERWELRIDHFWLYKYNYNIYTYIYNTYIRIIIIIFRSIIDGISIPRLGCYGPFWYYWPFWFLSTLHSRGTNSIELNQVLVFSSTREWWFLERYSGTLQTRCLRSSRLVQYCTPAWIEDGAEREPLGIEWNVWNVAPKHGRSNMQRIMWRPWQAPATTLTLQST